MPRVTFEKGREKWSVTSNRANEVTSYSYQRKTSENSSVKFTFKNPFIPQIDRYKKETIKNSKPRKENLGDKEVIDIDQPFDQEHTASYTVSDAKSVVKKFAKTNILNLKINEYNADYKWYDLNHSYNLYISLDKNDMATLILWRDNKDKVRFEVSKHELYNWFDKVVK